MDESRAHDGDDAFWAGTPRPIAAPVTPASGEPGDGSALQELVERQPVFVMAATVLFAVGALCVVMGAFLLA